MDRMNDALITCEIVDERDLDTRYLAGTLAEPEAEAFEAHYFGCERCWALVRQGSEVRAASVFVGEIKQPLVVPDPIRMTDAPVRRRNYRLWLGLAAAGVCAAAGLTLWHQPQTDSDDAVRGGSETLPLTAEVRGDSLFTAWPRVPGAAQYRLRLFTLDAVLLLEREVADTALALPKSVLATAGGPDQALAQIEAESAVRETLARSALQTITASSRQ